MGAPSSCVVGPVLAVEQMERMLRLVILEAVVVARPQVAKKSMVVEALSGVSRALLVGDQAMETPVRASSPCVVGPVLAVEVKEQMERTLRLVILEAVVVVARPQVAKKLTVVEALPGVSRALLVGDQAMETPVRASSLCVVGLVLVVEVKEQMGVLFSILEHIQEFLVVVQVVWVLRMVSPCCF
jgi:hypothetical protein